VIKIVAFAGAALGLGLCFWSGSWGNLAPAHGATPTLVVAGGLFTAAIAVLIRD
jgi:hypothetical protein